MVATIAEPKTQRTPKQANGRHAAELMLRDIAFVLKLTRQVKNEIIEERRTVDAPVRGREVALV